MLELDGTENKCKLRLRLCLCVVRLSICLPVNLSRLPLQLSLALTPSWACPWPSARPEQQRKAFPSTAILPILPDTKT